MHTNKRHKRTAKTPMDLEQIRECVRRRTRACYAGNDLASCVRECVCLVTTTYYTCTHTYGMLFGGLCFVRSSRGRPLAFNARHQCVHCMCVCVCVLCVDGLDA